MLLAKAIAYHMLTIRLQLNFWEAKQLEYWLADNYPECTIKILDPYSYRPADAVEQYIITGKIDVDLACLLQLKYGTNVSTSS